MVVASQMFCTIAAPQIGAGEAFIKVRYVVSFSGNKGHSGLCSVAHYGTLTSEHLGFLEGLTPKSTLILSPIHDSGLLT